MKYIVDENNLEETTIVVRGSKGNIREIKLKDLDEGVDDDVLFYDYDGTLLYAYKADDFLKMDRFPGNPQHDGLISRGWNWSFEGAQNYVRKYGKLNVGQMYAYDYSKLPESQRNALLIEMYIPEGGVINIPLLFLQSVSHGVEIDWGDGSEIETVEGTGVVTTSHQYPSDNAVYTIAVKTLDDCEIQYGDGENQKNIFGSQFNTPNSNYGTAMNVTSIVFPQNLEKIDDYSFVSCKNLNTLIIPEKCKSIGNYAFNGCSKLESILISKGVISIGSNTFYGCVSVKSLTIPEGVTSIGQSAFYTCRALKSLIIPDGMTSIGNLAFSGCNNLQSLTIPEGVTDIGAKIFESCSSLQSLVISEGVMSIGLYAFSDCYKLKSLTLPESMTNVGESAFSCGLGNLIISLTLPSGIETIGRLAFRGFMNVRSIIIQEGVKNIGDSAFMLAVNLAKITIPSSVERIDMKAFLYCCALTSITMFGQIPPTLTNSNAFQTGGQPFTIYVPYSEDHSVLNAYKTATNWSAYADNIVESEPVAEETEEPVEEVTT